MTTTEYAGLIQTWVSETVKSKVTFALLWKGSRDGFTASAFHARCNGRGPTLTVVASTNGNLFGGYTSLNWGAYGTYAYDSTAFLYSLTHKVKCAQKDTTTLSMTTQRMGRHSAVDTISSSTIIAIRAMAVTPAAITHTNYLQVLTQRRSLLDQRNSM